MTPDQNGGRFKCAFDEFAGRMRSDGIQDATIRAFEVNYANLAAGQTGKIPETEIVPVSETPLFEDVTEAQDYSLLGQALMLKLNGGLGTSMGLEGPKSLLRIRDDLTFLDLIAKQILHMRETYRLPVRFLLMNSRSTSNSTIAFLKKYPELGEPSDAELMQGYVLKVDAASLRPVRWPKNPDLEWCPPGHGDLYSSLLGSGWLDRLLNAGVRYLFVSNSDNLGASMDVGLLTYFASTGLSFLMEVAERTAADRKGGHLARGLNGKLLLRESAQCPDEDMEVFQDINRHRFFNTNNLWIRLDHLKVVLEENDGVIPLPLIKNKKNVDPRDQSSTPVFQLETAMGAAIGSFEKTGAVKVPRSRFAPVKTTSDLLAIRSDAYEITPDWRVVLTPDLAGKPPPVDLDPDHYKLVDQLDSNLQETPSLKGCQSLRIRGPISLGKGIVFEGKVDLVNPTVTLCTLKSGVYKDIVLTATASGFDTL